MWALVAYSWQVEGAAEAIYSAVVSGTQFQYDDTSLHYFHFVLRVRGYHDWCLRISPLSWSRLRP